MLLQMWIAGRLLAVHRRPQGRLRAPAQLECGDSIQRTRLELKCQYVMVVMCADDYLICG